jgi:inhibitor of cysteine peptidase
MREIGGRSRASPWAGLSPIWAIPVLTLSVCAGPAPPRQAGAPPPQKDAVILTVADHESEVKAAVGDTVAVRLEASLGTGYSWQVGKNDEAILKPVGKPTFEPLDQPKPGSPEMQVLRFRAAAPGLARLELRYVRPWEKDVAPAKVFRVTIRVQ